MSMAADRAKTTLILAKSEAVAEGRILLGAGEAHHVSSRLDTVVHPEEDRAVLRETSKDLKDVRRTEEEDSSHGKHSDDTEDTCFSEAIAELVHKLTTESHDPSLL